MCDDLAAEEARLYLEMDERHRALKSDVAAALAEAQRGESRELDIDAIKRELAAELNERGEPEPVTGQTAAGRTSSCPSAGP